MGFILGLASDVAANVIFWTLLGIIFWAAGATIARRFSRFFGLSRADAVAVYVSNLWNPLTNKRPVGYAISLHELRLRKRWTGSSAPHLCACQIWCAA